MRLLELNNSIETLPNITKKNVKLLKELNINTFSDLLCYKPRKIIDRTKHISLYYCKNQIITTKESSTFNTCVKIVSTGYFGQFKNQVFRASAIDVKDNTPIDILCFGRNFFSKILKKDSLFYLYGQATLTNNLRLQTTVFEIKNVNLNYRKDFYSTIDIIYPLTNNLTNTTISTYIKYILDHFTFTNELNSHILNDLNIYDINKALKQLHFPFSSSSFYKALKSLKTIELFYFILSTMRKRKLRQSKKDNTCELEKKVIQSLSFKLTDDQEYVLNEIDNDLNKKTVRMNRLLQGDVGCGKTLIALLSSLHIINSGGQVALMAPTEILAYQHAINASKMLEKLGVTVAFLSSSISKKGRTSLLKALSEKKIDLLIGTHALFSKDVEFNDLRYIIIDEQHRFGVEQRDKLKQKGKHVHVLNMSATPIPRTLILSMYGDVSVSTINTMPLERKEIITYLVSEKSRDRMYASIKVELKRGHQVYFVYPKIDESENSDLRDVNSMYQELKLKYPEYKSSIIHGKLSDEEKSQILDDFNAHKIDYIVATSVVEVGIDIKNATIMVVEHAERFGLAQLHQIRGRVGRSDLQSYCFLVYSENLSEDGVARMKIMKNSTDGFYISEQDLRLRGPGDVKGLKQSGYIPFRFASIANDIDLLDSVHLYLTKLIKNDPYFTSDENHLIKTELKDCLWFSHHLLL